MTTIPILHNGTLCTFKPTERRSQVNTNMMQFTIMKQFNIICDILEITQLVILEILLLVLVRGLECILCYAVVFCLVLGIVF